MPAPRCIIEVWKPKITVVNSSGVDTGTPQEPDAWIRCDTIEDVGTNQKRGNPLSYISIEETIFNPKKAFLTLSNKAQNFKAYDEETFDFQYKDSDNNNMSISGSGATSKLRKAWGPFTHFFRLQGILRIVEENTHMVLFQGNITKISKKFQEQAGSVVMLECADALQHLIDIKLNDLVHKAKFKAITRRSDIIQYLLNVGVNYQGTKPEAATTQGNKAVEGDGALNSPQKQAALSGPYQWLNSNDNANAAASPPTEPADNSYKRFERSVTTIGQELDVNLGESGSGSLLTELKRWAILEPHADETAENAFGYDFFVDPNIDENNLTATFSPNPPMFNYVKRGNRLSATGSANQQANTHGLTVEFPVINTTNHFGATVQKVGELGAAIADDTVTTMIVKGGSNAVQNTIRPGQTVEIESEKIYVENIQHSISTLDILKVRRGHEGTTAAGHANNLDISEFRAAKTLMRSGSDFEEDWGDLITEIVLSFNSPRKSTTATGASSNNKKTEEKRFELMNVHHISGQYTYLGRGFDVFYQKDAVAGTNSAEFISAFREDGTTYHDGWASGDAGSTVSRYCAKIQYQSTASTGDGTYGFIILSDINANFPETNATVGGSVENYVILKGETSGRTCKLNCNSLDITKGRPSAAIARQTYGASGNGNTQPKVQTMSHKNGSNVDDLRREIAARLSQGTTPMIKGSFATAQAPYYWLDGYVRSIATGTGGQVLTFKHKNSSTAVNVTNFGVRAGMLVHKRTADYSSIAQHSNKDLYGYIKSMSNDTEFTVNLTQSQDFSVGDSIRIFIPVRAGDTVFVDNILADIYGEHQIMGTKFENGLFPGTVFTTMGENEPRIRIKSAHINRVSAVWNAVAKTQLESKENSHDPGIPLGLQSFTLTGTSNVAAVFDYPTHSSGVHQVTWYANSLETADGRVYKIAASNTSDATHGVGNAGMTGTNKYIIYLDPEGENPSGTLDNVNADLYHLKTVIASDYVQDNDNIVVLRTQANGSGTGAKASSAQGPNHQPLHDVRSTEWADDLLQEASLSGNKIIAGQIGVDHLAANMVFTKILQLDSAGRLITASGLERQGSSSEPYLNGTGVLLDETGIYGASGGNLADLQFFLKASDGKARLGSDTALFSQGGIELKAVTNQPLKFMATVGSGQPMASMDIQTVGSGDIYESMFQIDGAAGLLFTVPGDTTPGGEIIFARTGHRSGSVGADVKVLNSTGGSNSGILKFHGGNRTSTSVGISGPATSASQSAVSTSYVISLPSAGPTADGQVLAVKDISGNNYQQLEWVAQSGGATLAGDQTWTGDNTFNGEVIFNDDVIFGSDFPGDLMSFGGQIRLANGSYASSTYTPSLAFTNATTTGWRMYISSNTINVQHMVGNALIYTATADDGNGGTTLGANRQINWYAPHDFNNGVCTEAFSYRGGQVGQTSTTRGSNTAPVFSFDGNTQSGMYLHNGQLTFVVPVSGTGTSQFNIDDDEVNTFNHFDMNDMDIWNIDEMGFDDVPATGSTGHKYLTIQNVAGNSSNYWVTTYGAVSSNRYKNDIRDIEVDTSNVYKLQARTFVWKNDAEVLRDKIGTTDFGLIAEEVYEVLPELVELQSVNPPIPQSVNYEYLSVLLLEELKKLKDRIDILEGS